MRYFDNKLGEVLRPTAGEERCAIDSSQAQRYFSDIAALRQSAEQSGKKENIAFTLSVAASLTTIIMFLYSIQKEN